MAKKQDPLSSSIDESDLDVLDISDVPVPPTEARECVDDELKAKPAFKFCFLGSGQGGGRLAQQFYSMGYRRVATVNTAIQDSEPLQVPDEFKLVIGHGGAGGSRELGRKAAAEHREDIFDFIRKRFGQEFDRIMITVTAGGGSGSGSVEELVSICHDYVEKMEMLDPDDPKVGVIVALPKEADGKKAHANAYETLNHLVKMAPRKISPLIIIDNQRIEKLFPSVPVGKFWQKANSSVCSIFHLLNLVANRQSEYTSFDRMDLNAILKSGILAFGAMPVSRWSSREAISVAIRDNLKRNVLVGGADLSTGNVAGCVVVANEKVLHEIPQEYLDEGFSMLGRMLRTGSAVHRGIYAGNNPDIVVYTIIGGLDAPTERINDLRRVAGL